MHAAAEERLPARALAVVVPEMRESSCAPESAAAARSMPARAAGDIRIHPHSAPAATKVTSAGPSTRRPDWAATNAAVPIATRWPATMPVMPRPTSSRTSSMTGSDEAVGSRRGLERTQERVDAGGDGAARRVDGFGREPLHEPERLVAQAMRHDGVVRIGRGQRAGLVERHRVDAAEVEGHGR